jgi:NarL family two-component system response regulator LiaR
VPSGNSATAELRWSIRHNATTTIEIEEMLQVTLHRPVAQGLGIVRERATLIATQPRIETSLGQGARVSLARPAETMTHESKPMNEAQPIRVLVVDDHAVVRSGLAAFMSAFPEVELAGEAEDGERGVLLCNELRPDVVLMDLVMPGMDGIAATAAIHRSCPETQVIALTSFKDESLVQGALQAGAIGYLLKDATANELIQAICAAHEGRSTLSPEAVEALVRTTAQEPPLGHDLTPREREVLVLMADGLTNGEIAARLTISRSTARAHVSNILSKLGAASRGEAIAQALRHGLIS